MNILFLAITKMDSIDEHMIYTDLLRCLRDRGHKIYFMSTHEKRRGLPTEFTEEGGTYALRVKTGNITKSNAIEKGIATVLIEGQFLRAAKKYLSDVKFDLVLYTTPPVTFARLVEYIKKRDGAKTYLLLKDIFPQDAVDVGSMSKTGLTSIMYRYFRKKETKLYELSDMIGCMSPANAEYILKENPEIDPEKVEICPNSMEIRDFSLDGEQKDALRKKYGIPTDKTVFIYGGNLGKFQGIEYLVQCLNEIKGKKDVFFVIAGNGTDYHLIDEFCKAEKPENVLLLPELPRDDYDRLTGACDVGLIFLNHKFTIPNFPQRILSYMQARIPILASTDVCTDLGTIITENGFGWWCESNDPKRFSEMVDKAADTDRKLMGEKGFDFLVNNYSVEGSCDIICK